MTQRSMLVMFVVGSISACSPQSGQGLPGDWSLRFTGAEQVELEKEGVKQPTRAGAIATIYYRWNDSAKTLVSEHENGEPAAFCQGQGQEQCTVGVQNGRLLASSFDVMPGKQPD